MKLWRFIFLWIFLYLVLIVLSFYSTLNPVQRFYAPQLTSLVKSDITTHEQDPSSSQFPTQNLNSHFEKITSSFNVLILGLDARGDEKSRSDLIMLVNINPVTKEVNIVSIPRDTRIKIPGVGYTKINHAHILGEIKGDNHEGTMAAVKAVSDLCQCEIHFYVKVHFKGFQHFIDTIGGIDIKLAKPIKLTYKEIIIPAGKQHINGELALELVQERKSLADGDFGRQRHQILILKAIAAKLLKTSSILKMSGIIEQVQDYVMDTNFTNNDLISLALLFKDSSLENLNYFQVPGKDMYEFDQLLQRELYFWLPDLAELKQIINNF